MYPVQTDVGLEVIIGGIRMDDDRDLWWIEWEIKIDLAVECGASREVHIDGYETLRDGAVRRIGCWSMVI